MVSPLTRKEGRIEMNRQCFSHSGRGEIEEQRDRFGYVFVIGSAILAFVFLFLVFLACIGCFNGTSFSEKKGINNAV